LKIYIIKRIALLLPLLFGITLITFTLTKALPGDPVYTMVGERTSPEIIAKIRKEIGADKGILHQYVGYLSLLARGEMGRSYYTQRRVLDDIATKFPNTMKLAAGAMLIAVPFGILLGFLSAFKKDTAIDTVITSISIVGLSVPVFWAGLILMFFLSLKARLLPPSGTGGVRYLILPSITLALPAIATLVRITRVSVLEVVNLPFVKTARAKGIGEFRIQAVHIMKNVMIPVVTVIGLDFGSYLSGAVLTETIFGWDGIGRFTMEGILKRDYPVIMGCIIVSTLVFVLINFVVDIIYHLVDPRVRVHGTRG
jgi:ABC-type dipeptide/oligopeptide/nickel transport system permease component